MIDRLKHGMRAGLGTVAVVAAAGLGIAACGDSGNSGSSAPQPTCDGTAASGLVDVTFIPSPCVATVSELNDCPTAMICAVAVTNDNAQEITVTVETGSANLAPLQFNILAGANDIQSLVYTCPVTPVDESGTLTVNVSLAGGPGAFCGADDTWDVDIVP